jgi:hypothetical protein
VKNSAKFATNETVFVCSSCSSSLEFVRFRELAGAVIDSVSPANSNNRGSQESRSRPGEGRGGWE